eukprot:scaffold26495_cov103-Cylindrotheca_fusiformis.AAC.2
MGVDSSPVALIIPKLGAPEKHSHIGLASSQSFSFKPEGLGEFQGSTTRCILCSYQNRITTVNAPVSSVDPMVRQIGIYGSGIFRGGTNSNNHSNRSKRDAYDPCA